MLSLLTSLISPTSRFLLSTILPFESAGPRAPGGPALTGVHGEVIVPGPTIPSAKKEEKENYVININMYFKKKESSEKYVKYLKITKY